MLGDPQQGRDPRIEPAPKSDDSVHRDAPVLGRRVLEGGGECLGRVARLTGRSEGQDRGAADAGVLIP